MARAIVSRLLHEPTLRLKERRGDVLATCYVQALRELFGLETPQRPSAEARQPPAAEVTRLDAAGAR